MFNKNRPQQFSLYIKVKKFLVANLKIKVFNLIQGFRWRNLAILIFPTVFFTWYIFKPLKYVNIPVEIGSSPVIISQSQVNQELNTDILADLINTPLNLNWYNLCLKNFGFLTVNGVTIREPSPNLLGDAILKVKSVDVSEIKAQPGKTDCITINTRDKIEFNLEGLETSFGSLAEFGPGSKQIDEKTFQAEFKFDFTKLEITLRNNVWQAILAKFFVTLIFWSSLFLLLREIYKFVRKPNHPLTETGQRGSQKRA